ncbi:GlxA family transcriptional regulator [Microlunatus sp. Gsoil 973]|uniref:GlxA family transcriptional regulator n=1 Tax=Microlunatus sp. Gsoil 973 TaxID=2672569 RepID=UPI0012B44A53|nr:GlxA family transcriptional regulator [Microlunatus sp. Gsoil 973]QGN32227.1 helix-turn-helix domain-containing protein [Microlunatus sp. Gsoil 973]
MTGTTAHPRRIVVVGYREAELLDIACITTALEIADRYAGRKAYQVFVASPGGRPIHTWTGLLLQAQLALEELTDRLDTLIVVGGLGYLEAMDDPVLVGHIRRLARQTRRVASVCTGAGILAAGGLLDGHRAATHWDHSEYLSRRFPKVRFDRDPIHLTDRGVATSAGVTAALDLTLSFIEADLGAELARNVARQMVTYLQRPGNQAQMSMFTAPPAAGNPLVHRTVDHITTHIDADLSTATLAALAGVSERHLTRLFLSEIGVTPGRFVRRARTEAAAHLLTGTDLTIETIAARCGFGTSETLRQSFQTQYGVSPSHYRNTQSSSRPRPRPTAIGGPPATVSSRPRTATG